MTRVYMIGVSHDDPAAPGKLRSKLLDLMPDAVFCEGSLQLDTAQEFYLRAIKEALSAKNAARGLASILLEEQELKGYEGRVAREYCRSAGALFEYLDDTFETRCEADITAYASLSVENFMKTNEKEARAVFDKEIRRLKRYIGLIGRAVDAGTDYALSPVLLTRNRHVGSKDAIMEESFRLKIAGTNYEKIATITGMAHLLNNPERTTFYCRLSDLNPMRFIVYD